MARRPVIGLVTQTLPPQSPEKPPLWVIGPRYVEVLRAAGGVPWVIPLLSHDPDTLHEIFSRLDGVLLTGGADVDPARYGEPKLPVCGYIDPDRDAVELALLHHAEQHRLPVLAVCRGIQILNVAGGGTLYQDIPTQVPAALKHDHFTNPQQPSRKLLSHEVTMKPGTRLHGLLGAAVVSVNSMHHQAIKELAPGLTATAYAPDGVIEAVESAGDRFVLAVQWHPEELTDGQPGMRRLFEALVAAC